MLTWWINFHAWLSLSTTLHPAKNSKLLVSNWHFHFFILLLVLLTNAILLSKKLSFCLYDFHKMSTVYIWRPVLGFVYETKLVDKPPSNDSTHFTARDWLFKPLRPHSVSIKHDPTTETAGLVMFVEFCRFRSQISFPNTLIIPEIAKKKKCHFLPKLV